MSGIPRRLSVDVIRRGISRDVILVGRWAIKVPTFRYGFYSFAHGLLANHSERQWSGTPGVAPVLWSAWGFINVYPRCEPIEFFDGDYDAISPMPFGDRKADNLGLLDGRVVWLDYDGSWNGCPHTRAAYPWGFGYDS